MAQLFSLGHIDAMQIIPHGRQDWLRVVVFPFKAYVVISTLMFFVSATFPHPPHSGGTWAESFYLGSLIPCGLILLLAALLFGFFGPKGHALSCAFFGLAACLICAFISPILSH